MKVSVVVIDGITIGHPCCGVLHCAESLANNRDRFCPSHHHHRTLCAIVGCEKSVVEGRLTCSSPNHSKLEEYRKAKGKAFFQLKSQLERSRVSNPEDSTEAQPTVEETEEMVLDDGEDDACAGKDEDGNRKLQAVFGRRRTHNEQIIVRPCGMIVARRTFHGSESLQQTVARICVLSLSSCI